MRSFFILAITVFGIILVRLSCFFYEIISIEIDKFNAVQIDKRAGWDAAATTYNVSR